MKKIIILCLVVLLAAATGAYAKDFPKKNITNVVVWGAGGGTDTCNRIISAEMAKVLGVNINVINKTGGVARLERGARRRGRGASGRLSPGIPASVPSFTPRGASPAPRRSCRR